MPLQKARAEVEKTFVKQKLKEQNYDNRKTIL